MNYHKPKQEDETVIPETQTVAAPEGGPLTPKDPIKNPNG